MTNRRPVLLWIILAVGAIARLAFLGRKSLSFFEARNVFFAQRYISLTAIMNLKAQEPAGYPLGLHFFLFLGRSEALIRMLSVLASIGSVYILWLIADRILGRKGGLGAAALMALMPIQIFFAQDATAYALGGFFALGAVWAFIRFLETGKDETQDSNAAIRNRWRAWAVWMLLALYTLHVALVLFGLFIIFAWRICKGKSFKQWRIWRRGLGLVALYYVPGLIYLALQILNNILAPDVSRLIMPIGFRTISERFAAIVLGHFSISYVENKGSLMFFAVLCLIFVLVPNLLKTSVKNTTKKDEWDKKESDVSVKTQTGFDYFKYFEFLGFLLLLGWILSAILPGPRGLGFAALFTPAFCLLIGLVVKKNEKLGVIVIGLIGFIFIHGAGLVYTNPKFENFNWRFLSEYIEKYGPEKDHLYGVAVFGIDDPYTPRFYINRDRFELYFFDHVSQPEFDEYLTVRDGLWELIPSPWDLKYFMLQEEKFAVVYLESFPITRVFEIVPSLESIYEHNKITGNIGNNKGKYGFGLNIAPFISYSEANPNPMIEDLFRKMKTPWDAYVLLKHLPPERFRMDPEFISTLGDTLDKEGAETKAQDCWEIALDIIGNARKNRVQSLIPSEWRRTEFHSHAMLVESYLADGFKPLAQEQMGQAVELDPENPELGRLRELLNGAESSGQ